MRREREKRVPLHAAIITKIQLEDFFFDLIERFNRTEIDEALRLCGVRRYCSYDDVSQLVIYINCNCDDWEAFYAGHG